METSSFLINVNLNTKGGQSQIAWDSQPGLVVHEEGILESIFLTKVDLDHIDRLEVLGEASEYEGPHQFLLVVVHAMLDIFCDVPFVKREVIIDDTTYLKVSKVDLLHQDFFNELIILIAIESVIVMTRRFLVSTLNEHVDIGIRYLHFHSQLVSFIFE